MSKDKMFAKMILASRNKETGDRIFTIHAHYPRFIHSEMMTHRAFSRNARSSRAVPIKKMIDEVSENPVIPWHWHKDCPGMQGREECKAIIQDLWCDDIFIDREEAWEVASRHALEVAEMFMNSGYHKQIVNRLLEPFMWIDTLITSTQEGLDNFFNLRIHDDAEPHIRDLANEIYKAVIDADIQDLSEGEWHLPFIQGKEIGINEDLKCKISAARCARISYTPFDSDKSDPRKDMELFEKLAGSEPIHASPLEHQAKANAFIKRSGNFGKGWIQFRQIYIYGA